MAGKEECTRKPRTRFSPGQLRVLRDVSQRTLYPDWVTIRDVASETQLEEYVVHVWFKNQRAKRKRIEVEGRSFPVAKHRSGSMENPYSPEESLTPGPSALSTCSPLGLGSSLPEVGEQPKGAAASVWSPALHDEPRNPFDYRGYMDLLAAPWESIVQDLKEFIQNYYIPGANDKDSLDRNGTPQVLLPSVDIQNVASETQLDEYVVQVGFNNQPAKRKRIEAEGRSFPALKQSAGSEEDSYSPEDSLTPGPSALSTCSPLDLGAPLAENGEPPKGASASVWSPALHAKPWGPFDYRGFMDLLAAPWESIVQDLKEFIQNYRISGNNDLDSLDQHLPPSVDIPSRVVPEHMNRSHF